jgi:predicted GH43/DUF377 family glycosyl hydrolase
LYWRKKGLVFEPTGQFGWINSHAQVPTALVLQDRLRIYFASRPENGISLPTFVDLDRQDPRKIIALHPKPILTLGRPGTFDADGVMPAAVIRDGGAILMYYSGWSRLGGRAPYNNATGLAVSRDEGVTFERVFEGPILDRTPMEPWSATSPAVVHTKNEWAMWYSSGTDWIEVEGKLEHVYVLKGARSQDGRLWIRDNAQILPTLQPSESQTRPTVAHIDGCWHMWFRTTGETYRIGHAWSDDLQSWQRDDGHVGISRSDEGWDSQMICYPEVVTVEGKTLMFYNGNAFGKCGFGYALLEKGQPQ